MNKINYQKKLDEIILNIEKTGIKPSLLMHCCCAPCSSYCLEYLNKYFDITVLYYNPNISPFEEYEHRKSELRRFINEKFKKDEIKSIDCDWENDKFLSSIKGLEKEKEGEKRCKVCFTLRLEKAAKVAAENNFDYFVTTLSISPLKDANLLNEIGIELSEKYNVKYLPSDFKKKEGYKRSLILSKEYNLYRQNFCGCVFSSQTKLI